MLIHLFIVSHVFSQRLPESLQELLKKSTEGDYGNVVTCKKPSVKTMVYLWDNEPFECVSRDRNVYKAYVYQRFIEEKSHEYRQEFSKIWNEYSDKAWGMDSWRPIKGEGVDNKGGVKRMIYNNLDSVFFLGNKDQFNKTSDLAVKNVDLPSQDVDIYEFITGGIGGLFSAYHLAKDPLLLKKAKAAGEALLLVYQNWFPYSSYNFKSANGTYNEIPLKLLLNVGELYMLSHYTQDPRYKLLIESIIEKLQPLETYTTLPHHAVIKNNKFTFVGYLTSDESSAEVQKILWNNWILSNQTVSLFKTLYDKNKKYMITSLPFSSNKGDLILIERAGDDGAFRMNLKMCRWIGTLAEESFKELNLTEIKFAEKLIKTCFAFFDDKNVPSDVIYLDNEKIYQDESDFSIPSELFESLYYMYKATNNNYYRVLADTTLAKIRSKFQAKFGYSVTYEDLLPDDFLSKTLKYLFLLYNDSPLFHKGVFSAAGHYLEYN